MKSKVQAPEMKILRLMKGITPQDWLQNNVQIEPVLSFVEGGQLRWYGYIKRMEAIRYHKMNDDWIPPEKRLVGRPRIRWKQNTEDAIIKRGSTKQEVEQ